MQTTYPNLDLPLLEGLDTLADAPAIGRWFPPTFAGEPTKVQLTPRLADVLVGAMRGETNKAIGHRLHLTEDTIKTHMRRLLAKVGARDRTHAVALFLTGEIEVYVSVSSSGRPARRPPTTRLARLDEHDPL